MTNESHTLIFLTYNEPDLIDKRLDEVHRHLAHRDDFKVLVFDNGSEDYGVKLALTTRVQMDMGFPLKVHTIKKNVGFGKGFNKAVAQADPSIVHLISSDVVIFGDFLKAHPLPWGYTEIRCHNTIRRPAGWNQFGTKVIHYPEGYYLAMHLETWQDLGGFDERFYPYDYEDLDLGYRITQHESYTFREIATLPLRHAGAGTIGYTDARFEHTVNMRALFAEKWGLPNEPQRP